MKKCVESIFKRMTSFIGVMKTRLVFLFLSAAVIGRRNFAQIQFSLAVEVVEIPLIIISIPIFNPKVSDRFWVGSFHAERAAAMVMVVVLLLVVVLLQVIVLLVGVCCCEWYCC